MALPSADRTLVMGVLNITPDSFSDGGRFIDLEAAIEQGHRLIAEGADLIDIGGESTRPGASRVDEVEEQRRVVPVIAALRDAGVPISVDTMRASTAAKALEAGAQIINDVSGGLADPDLVKVVAESGCAMIAMHWRGHSDRMQQSAHYGDVVAEVCAELKQRVDVLVESGVEHLAIDPGLGFSKDPDHNWALLRELDQVMSIGYPVLVGGSRKRFLGRLLADHDLDRDVAHREAATIALSALLAKAGVWAVRVHAVRGNADAVRVGAAMR